jgi:hypothetical protein
MNDTPLGGTAMKTASDIRTVIVLAVSTFFAIAGLAGSWAVAAHSAAAPFLS